MTTSGLPCRVAIAALVLALAPATVLAESFWVGHGWLCTHSTLQAAIETAQSDAGDDDEIFLVGGGPFVGSFAIIGGGLTIVGGVPRCGATTPTTYATLQSNSSQRPLSILMGREDRITLRRLVITTRSRTLRASGGGIWVAGEVFGSSELVLDDSQVVDNRSLGEGGGIFVSGVTVRLTGGSLVSGNTAYSGGGIAAVNYADILVDSGHVVANTAHVDGGGIYAPGAAVEVGGADGPGLQATVSYNVAGNDGGGVYVGHFSRFGRTAAVAISGNQAWRGGGIFADQTGMLLQSAEIKLNRASEAGGGVYVSAASAPDDLFVVSDDFVPPVEGYPRWIDNRAGEGAALYVDGPLLEVRLRAGSFRDHDTAAGGGALVAASGGAYLYLRGVTFSGNRASELFAVEGGATLTLHHASIAANDVTRLIRWDGSSPGVRIAASAFSETEPLFSVLPIPQVLPQLACIVNHHPSLLQGVPSGTDLSQVVLADPLFVAPDRGDLHAWPGSPVVDLCTLATDGFEFFSGYDSDLDHRGFDDPFRSNPQHQDYDAGADEVVAIAWDDFESGALSRWDIVEPPVPGSGNSVQIAAEARLGPPTSQYGLQLSLVDPGVQSAHDALVWASPPLTNSSDRARLDGSFFIDPQGLTMSTAAGFNRLPLFAFFERLARRRLTFALKRASAETWFLEATSWPGNNNNPVVLGSAFFACAGPPCGNPADWRNNRIEFQWRGGDSGRLTVWRTRYVDGMPDATGRVNILSVDLPMPDAVIDEVRIGTLGAGEQPIGSFGQIFLDEVSFTR